MTDTDSVFGARFIRGTQGHLFVMLRRPAGACTGRCVLFVPPFGEEMNKSRRMYALTSSALAKAGHASLMVDLRGTGDSEGEFGDATWSGWIEDIGTAVRWAKDEGWAVDRVLALRLGCALAAAACASLPLTVSRSVLWQPLFEGKRFVTQQLRMRVMSSEMADGREKVSELRARLAAGECLEMGGYAMSPSMIDSLDALGESGQAERLGHIHWYDIVRDPVPQSGTPAKADLTMLGAASIVPQQVVGDPFWSTVEIVVLPQLISSTVTVLAGSV